MNDDVWIAFFTITHDFPRRIFLVPRLAHVCHWSILYHFKFLLQKISILLRHLQLPTTSTSKATHVTQTGQQLI